MQWLFICTLCCRGLQILFYWGYLYRKKRIETAMAASARLECRAPPWQQRRAQTCGASLASSDEPASGEARPRPTEFSLLGYPCSRRLLAACVPIGKDIHYQVTLLQRASEHHLAAAWKLEIGIRKRTSHLHFPGNKHGSSQSKRRDSFCWSSYRWEIKTRLT